MRAPLDVARVTPHGAWGYYRSSSGRRHAGVDLGAARGTTVRAPEGLTVIAVASDNATRPLSGYGPGAILARGDSGAIHVLGHLEASHGARVGQRFVEGDRVGEVSRLGHVHWEVRKPDRAPWPRSSRIEDTHDPMTLLSPIYGPVRNPDGPVREPDGGAPAPVRNPDSSAIVILALLLLAHAHR